MNLKTKNIVKVAAIVIVTMITILLVLFFNTSNPSKSAEGEDKIIMVTTSTSTSTSECTSTTTNTTSISTIESTLTSTTNTTSIINKKNKETDRVKITKEKKTTVVTTPINIIETTTVATTEVPTEAPTEPTEMYVVFKPETHYIHKNSCHWAAQGIIERIETTEGIEARRCSECNPEIEIITPYKEPLTSVTNTAISVTDYEYTILCNLVAGEYGSDWVSIYDKGAVVATVIHRMWEGTRWTNGAEATIYNVIAAPYQYDGKYLSSSYSSKVTQSCKDAVTYALNNIKDYDYYTNPNGTTVYMINSFYGDGTWNYFNHY